MSLNFSDLLTSQNILFFAIFSIIVFIITVIFFLIVNLIFKFIFKIFKFFLKQREEINQVAVDKGEDLKVVVKELEESKIERQKVDSKNYQSQIPVPEKKKIEQKEFNTQEQKNIEEHLKTLKSTGVGGIISGTYQRENSKLFRKDQYNPASSELRFSISETKGNKVQNNNQDRPENLEKIINKNINNKDESIFGGKNEINRMELRQKLRSAQAFSASKQVGLSMNAVERAQLEKEVFSQSLGGNISKTDLKWGIQKLSNKLLSTKDPVAHEKIRKQIKFFKKIGGIK